MKIIRSLADMQAWSLHKRRKGFAIGFVPTMGALHDGHMALVERARRENDLVVASLFVNPLQFGPKEDFKRYPRTEKADVKRLTQVQADIVFIPRVGEMYAPGSQTRVQVPAMATRWEGAVRPGHFEGVATVVAKLFNVVQPMRAYFGQKDYQQLQVITRMVHDLNFPIEIVPCETVREADGLAMSSRNRFLSGREREEAVKIYQSLYLGRELVESRVMTKAQPLIRRLTQVLATIPKSKVDYIAVADPDTLEPIDRIKRPVWLALAVRVGKTRLIDNIVIT
jgi:pantoate--beta-alanine ligase